MAYNCDELSTKDTSFCELEIIDMFPHDHPMLYEDSKVNKMAQQMQEQV